MRIAINAVATSPGGGLTNLLGLLKGWRKSDQDFEIVTILSNDTTFDRVSAFSDVTRVRRVQPMGFGMRAMWDRFVLPHVLTDLDTDVLLSNNFCSPAVNCPQVVHHQTLFTWTRGGKPYSLRSFAQRVAIRLYSSTATWNVFSTDFLRRQALNVQPALQHRSSVIHHGVDHDVFRPPESPRFPTFRLCALQSPASHKDNSTLLEAFGYLVARAPHLAWRLKIAGPGDWARWRATARRMGIAERVTWSGELDRRQTSRLLQESDALIYPSRSEAFGLPMIEGMACGTPVVAVESDVVEEIGRGAIITVPPGRADQVAKVVGTLYDSPALRETMRNRGLDVARSFSWKKAADRMSEILSRAASGGERP